MVSSGLAPYNLPRALDSLLLYQQPSSTTLYYSYLRVSALIEIRLSNETRGNYVRINIKSCSSEQGVWSPQTPARYITLHYIKQEGHKITLHYTKADFAGIGWTGWRRIRHHVQLLSSCYINSLRQPHRPTLTHIISCRTKGVFRPSSASVIS